MVARAAAAWIESDMVWLTMFGVVALAFMLLMS